MVAYSFKAQFVDPIRSGAKCQTIRGDRKRHARAGEELQLYTGMRTRSCRLIGIAICLRVVPIKIRSFTIERGTASIEFDDRRLTQLCGIDDFARKDGFADWQEMQKFWQKNHPGVADFFGVLIEWRAFCTVQLGNAA